MKTSFLTPEEVEELGLLSVGENVKISRFAQFYGKNIKMGNNVRIDDFCILSGEINIGSFVHISAYTALYGSFGIEIADFAGLSPQCTVFSATDDFSGNYFIGPLIDSEYRNVLGGKVTIGKYSQIGVGCIILPQVTIEEGVAIGAMSLIHCNIEAWKIAYGIPGRIRKNRSKSMLRFESKI
jgi:acetyltransferase-like isoleucine patch superfamily enzyme